MTATPPPAPDTRPRASLELTAADLARLHAGDVVVGYTVTDMGGSRERFTVALAQPAPTPSGDDARREYRIEDCDHGQAFDVYRAGYGTVAHCGGEADARQIVAGLIAAAALQEARDGWRLANETAERLLPIASRAEAAAARLRALQEEANTTARWARGAEVALRQERERLREVEGERDRLRARMLEFAEWCEIPGVAQRDFNILADRLRRAATPSTDEGGRA